MNTDKYLSDSDIFILTIGMALAVRLPYKKLILAVNLFTLYSPMARKAIQKDQIVKLIVGAGQASPSPPVGPALGSKGVKSMDFCKVLLRISFTIGPLYLSLCRNLTREQRI